MVTMSNNAPPLPSQPLDVLEREQTQVAAALQTTLHELWAQTPSTKQVIAWAEEHPLWAAGAAAGAGALAGALVTPSSRPVAPLGAAPAGGIFSSLLGQAMPMLGMAISELGRNLVLASLVSSTKENADPNEAQAENMAGDGI